MVVVAKENDLISNTKISLYVQWNVAIMFLTYREIFTFCIRTVTSNENSERENVTF